MDGTRSLEGAVKEALRGYLGRNLIGFKARMEAAGPALIAFFRIPPSPADLGELGALLERIGATLAAPVAAKWEVGHPLQQGKGFAWIPNEGWKDSGSEEPERLLAALQDPARPLQERHDAAQGLGRFPEDRVEKALFAFCQDGGEHPLLLDRAGESLGIVWKIRNTERENKIGALAPQARKAAEAILRISDFAE